MPQRNTPLKVLRENLAISAFVFLTCCIGALIALRLKNYGFAEIAIYALLIFIPPLVWGTFKDMRRAWLNERETAVTNAWNFSVPFFIWFAFVYVLSWLLPQ